MRKTPNYALTDPPRGLFYYPDICSSDRDRTLQFIHQTPWVPVPISATRGIQQYGFAYDYRARSVDPIQCIPAELDCYRDCLMATCMNLGLDIGGPEFNQCIVNKYEIEEGISSHVDAQCFGPVIGCFTLESGCVIEFVGDRIHEKYIADGSLYIMSGDARYNWTHCMPARKNDVVDGRRVARGRRISITWRVV